MDHMSAIFASLPPAWQWATFLAIALLLLTWLWMVVALSSLRRELNDFATDCRRAAERLSAIVPEQQGELIRRLGWAVTHLERIEQKIGYTMPPDMQVSSITAESIVVHPSPPASNGKTRPTATE
jgi:hypothetical protein